MRLARARLFFKMKRKKEREIAEKIKESFIGKHISILVQEIRIVFIKLNL
jgi:hypothetical protein